MSLDLKQVLNSHKNLLLEVARTSGIPLSYFKPISDGHNYAITINTTPLIFEVQQSDSDLTDLACKYTLFKPEFPESNRRPSYGWAKIDDIGAVFSDWLDNVAKKYLELASVPDQWSELMNIQPFMSSTTFSETDLEVFTDNEKEQIKDALSEFQRLIQQEIAPLKDDLNQITEKIEYLSKAVDRLNRFDWKGLTAGVVMSIATNLTVDTNTGKQIFDLFQQAFSSAIKFLPK